MAKAFVFANGEPDFPDALSEIIDTADVIICADGGTLHAASLALLPTIIIGDMDSIPEPLLKAFEQQGSETRKFPRDKDASDLELSLQAAVQLAADEIVCLCALGGRQDHALANILLFAKYATDRSKIVLLGRSWRAQFVTPLQAANFTGESGDTLSLIPISNTVTGVTICGARWPLDDATLHWGSSRTISNVFLEKTVSVNLHDGLMLAFHYAKSALVE
ncbi:MAG: thiamine diphosphokinase [Candidatus Obscuribacterales bacterium]|nr:thiamine diphosphokinase [Candidatus Obscuribacterales bacterium]